MSTVNSSNLPNSMKNESSHFPAAGMPAKLSTGPTVPRPGPTLPSEVATAFEQQQCDTVYGDILYVDQHNTNKVIRVWKTGQYNKFLFNIGWQIPHPSFYVKRALFLQHGLLIPEYKIASDYESSLRFIKKHGASAFYLNQFMVKMRMGGVSNRQFGSVITGNKEIRDAWKRNSLDFPFYMFFFKPFFKIKQYIDAYFWRSFNK